MDALRHSLRLPSGRELGAAVGAASATALIALLAMHKVGMAGIAAPLVVVVVLILLARPLFTVLLVVGLTAVCEGPSFGILTFTSHLYVKVYKDLTLLDLLVLIAVAAVAVDLLARRRPLRVPRPMIVPMMILALAMVAGAVTGHAAGTSVRFAIMSENVLAYLLFLPIAVANLDIDRRRLIWILLAAMALAIVKAILGLVEVAGHAGATIEGSETLTYYEPAANWLIMIGMFAVAVALLARNRMPRWILLGSPLLVACLILSYRRSFWIAAVLGLLLVVVLGTSPVGRRMLIPAALGLAIAIWALSTISLQSQSPVVKRIESLTPSRLEANPQASYRLDEQANVLTAIKAHPLTGLGVAVPWKANVRVLSVEHPEGREYVHFTALWYWLKLGLLGLLAYVAEIVAAMVLSFQAWRRSPEPVLRAFGLASLCAVVGLVAIETTASFTGVDPRFTVIFAAQMGLLAIAIRTAPAPDHSDLGAGGADPGTVRQRAPVAAA